MFLGLAVFYLGLVPALFTRKRQTLHDLIMGTVVVRTPRAGRTEDEAPSRP
jgi:uncharacterized RDD family membrane protein YckC